MLFLLAKAPNILDYLSFSRWRRCYKSRGSSPVFRASEVQKRSNAPVPGQKLATKVSKSRAIPPYVPGVNPPGMVGDKSIITVYVYSIFISLLSLMFVLKESQQIITILSLSKSQFFIVWNSCCQATLHTYSKLPRAACTCNLRLIQVLCNGFCGR